MRRRETGFFLKNAHKGDFICVSAHTGDHGNRMVCSGKQLFAVLQSAFDNIIFDTAAENLLIFVLQIGGTEGSSFANSIY